MFNVHMLTCIMCMCSHIHSCLHLSYAFTYSRIHAGFIHVRRLFVYIWRHAYDVQISFENAKFETTCSLWYKNHTILWSIVKDLHSQLLYIASSDSGLKSIFASRCLHTEFAFCAVLRTRDVLQRIEDMICVEMMCEYLTCYAILWHGMW